MRSGRNRDVRISGWVTSGDGSRRARLLWGLFILESDASQVETTPARSGERRADCTCTWLLVARAVNPRVVAPAKVDAAAVLIGEAREQRERRIARLTMEVDSELAFGMRRPHGTDDGQQLLRRPSLVRDQEDCATSGALRDGDLCHGLLGVPTMYHRAHGGKPVVAAQQRAHAAA